MIKQSEIAITDLHPNYGKHLYKGLDKQDKFLFSIHSLPLKCPACGELHTVNELKRNSPDWIKGKEIGGGSFHVRLMCGSIELQNDVSFFGEQSLSIKQ